jgi:hypothetical protein
VSSVAGVASFSFMRLSLRSGRWTVPMYHHDATDRRRTHR